MLGILIFLCVLFPLLAIYAGSKIDRAHTKRGEDFLMQLMVATAVGTSFSWGSLAYIVGNEYPYTYATVGLTWAFMAAFTTHRIATPEKN